MVSVCGFSLSLSLSVSLSLSLSLSLCVCVCVFRMRQWVKSVLNVNLAASVELFSQVHLYINIIYNFKSIHVDIKIY